MDENELQRRLDFAVDAAREAGELAMGIFRSRDFSVRSKGDGSPVTEADRRAETHLRQRIGAAYPEDGILGEEEGETPGSSGRTWILDPIDGTRSFVRGVPLFGTLIGLEDGGRIVLGVAHHPGVGETVAGARGLGARWHRGAEPARPARVSTVERLEDALVCTTSLKLFDEVGRGAPYRRLLDRVGLDRGWSDCYGLILVATGRADLLVEPQLHPWDCAPFVPILEEAGGRFSDWNGETTIYGGNGLASNGALFAAALDVLRG